MNQERRDEERPKRELRTGNSFLSFPYFLLVFLSFPFFSSVPLPPSSMANRTSFPFFGVPHAFFRANFRFSDIIVAQRTIQRRIFRHEA